MRNDAPIVLTADEHRRHIESFWRQKDIARLRDECLFEDEERVIARAMWEPEPAPIDKAVAAIWGGYVFFMLFGFLMLWEMMRP